MAKRYVDNSYNTNLGRVGMTHGSAVSSRSNGGSTCSVGSYANSSRSSSSNAKVYVDNKYNQRLGRVGIEIGNAAQSKSSASYSTPQKSTSSHSGTYVDNAYNRNVGRVGLDKGTAVVSKTSSSVSKSKTPAAFGSFSANYVDNAYNRRLGRVGLPLRSAPQSQCSTSTSKKTINNFVYVDNALNRKLGRVGLTKGSAPQTSIKHTTRHYFNNPFLQFDIERAELIDIFDHICNEKEKARDDYEYTTTCERAEGIVKRHIVARDKHSVSKQPNLCDGQIIDFSELEIGDKLGGGGFGDVHVALWKGEYQVAVKKLRVQRVRKEKKEQFEKEVGLFSTLKHYAIVHFYGACVETPNLAIVMEFMAAGSLYEIIHIELKQLTDTQKNQMIEDSFSALSYLHDKNIAHRDIKSRNIMVCEDLNHCKLADFGLALKDDEDSSLSVADFSVVGTYRYSPPEVLEGNRLTIEQLMSADVYSTALTMIELITEKEPFDGYNSHQLRKAVLDGEKPDIESGLISVALEKLLLSCLSKLAKNRPTAVHFFEKFQEFTLNVL